MRVYARRVGEGWKKSLLKDVQLCGMELGVMRAVRSTTEGDWDDGVYLSPDLPLLHIFIDLQLGEVPYDVIQYADMEYEFASEVNECR